MGGLACPPARLPASPPAQVEQRRAAGRTRVLLRKWSPGAGGWGGGTALLEERMAPQGHPPGAPPRHSPQRHPRRRPEPELGILWAGGWAVGAAAAAAGETGARSRRARAEWDAGGRLATASGSRCLCFPERGAPALRSPPPPSAEPAPGASLMQPRQGSRPLGLGCPLRAWLPGVGVRDSPPLMPALCLVPQGSRGGRGAGRQGGPSQVRAGRGQALCGCRAPASCGELACADLGSPEEPPWGWGGGDFNRGGLPASISCE